MRVNFKILTLKHLDIWSITICKVSLYPPCIIQLSEGICLAAYREIFLFIVISLKSRYSKLTLCVKIWIYKAINGGYNKAEQRGKLLLLKIQWTAYYVHMASIVYQALETILCFPKYTYNHRFLQATLWIR